MTTIYPYDYERDDYRPFIYKPPGQRRHGLLRAENDALQRNLTDPMHLLPWALDHKPPRTSKDEFIAIVRRLHYQRPVADALFPRARQRLIVAFFLFPEAIYRQHDLLRFCELGRGAGQRELINLEMAGLVERLPAVQLARFHYRANHQSPLFPVMTQLAQTFLYVPWQAPAAQRAGGQRFPDGLWQPAGWHFRDGRR